MQQILQKVHIYKANSIRIVSLPSFLEVRKMICWDFEVKLNMRLIEPFQNDSNEQIHEHHREEYLEDDEEDVSQRSSTAHKS